MNTNQFASIWTIINCGSTHARRLPNFNCIFGHSTLDQFKFFSEFEKKKDVSFFFSQKKIYPPWSAVCLPPGVLLWLWTEGHDVVRFTSSKIIFRLFFFVKKEIVHSNYTNF